MRQDTGHSWLGTISQRGRSPRCSSVKDLFLCLIYLRVRVGGVTRGLGKGAGLLLGHAPLRSWGYPGLGEAGLERSFPAGAPLMGFASPAGACPRKPASSAGTGRVRQLQRPFTTNVSPVSAQEDREPRTWEESCTFLFS